MKLIIVLCFFITGCINEYPTLSSAGVAGYEYCLNNPKEKLYMGKFVYSCGYYLIDNRVRYENTINQGG